MRKRTKHLCLIIGAQAVCLGVGVWMLHAYVDASVRRTSMEREWHALEANAAGLINTTAANASTASGRAALTIHDLARLLEGVDLKERGVILVDRTWQVLSLEDTPDEMKTKPAPLDWSPIDVTSPVPLDAIRGRITLSDGLHYALAYAPPGGGGYVVAHRSQAAIEANTRALVQPLAAIGFMTFLWTFILLGIAAYMIVARLHDEIDRQRSRSASESLRHAQTLIRTRDAVIFGLAKLADSRDPETGEHLERISVYSTILAAELSRHAQYQDVVTPTFVRLIGISSALHDIGKVGVEDRILRKPGRLTTEERRAMQIHASIGGNCLREIEQRLGSSNFLQLAREIAFAHHENWDGTGYPNGLAGEDIPLAARIVAIADVYDALSCKRVYKDPYPHMDCVKIIRDDAGKKFDPDIVAIWLKIESKFRDVSDRQVGLSRGEVSETPRDVLGSPFAEEDVGELSVASVDAKT